MNKYKAVVRTWGRIYTQQGSTWGYQGCLQAEFSKADLSGHITNEHREITGGDPTFYQTFESVDGRQPELDRIVATLRASLK